MARTHLGTAMLIGLLVIGALTIAGASVLVYAQESTDGSVTGIIGELNTSLIAIGSIIATVVAIASGVINWIRTKSGDKVISDQSNEWLQWLFENAKETDKWIQEIAAKVTENAPNVEIAVDVLKNLSPQAKEAIEANAPLAEKKLRDANSELKKVDEELERLYEVSPITDPVRPQ